MIGFLLGLIPNFMLPPLITLSLAQQGSDPKTIGIMASMQALGLLIALPLTPRIVRWAGERSVLLGASAAAILSLLGLMLTDALVVWALLSALTGASVGMRYVVAQSWITAYAPPAARSRTVGLFETLHGAGALAATGILLLTGVIGKGPLLVAGGFMAVGLMLIAAVPSPQPSETLVNGPRVRLNRRQIGSAVLVAAFLGGVFESGMLTALPLFSTTLNFNATLATLVVSVVGIGSMLQFVFGFLADRLVWKRVLLGTVGLVIAASMLLILVPAAQGLIWPLGLVLGAAGGGLYTLAIISVSTTLTGSQLVSGTTALAFLYTLGNSVGLRTLVKSGGRRWSYPARPAG